MLIDPTSPEGRLIETLRAEAGGARACFREMALKVLAFGVTATSIVFGLMDVQADSAPNDAPAARIAVAFVPLGVLLLLLWVQRIGVHKFNTVNRLLGYQLHLERLGAGDRLSGNMGWEEACRAWRNVQPPMFREIYRSPRRDIWPFWLDMRPDYFRYTDTYHAEIMHVRDQIRRTDRIDPQLASDQLNTRRSLKTSELWWMQAERAELAGGAYHAGGYLKRMFMVLSIAQVLAILPLWFLMFRAIPELAVGNRIGEHLLELAAFAVGTTCFSLNSLTISRRREMLEREFLSIHSCSIVWKAIAMAHDLAWNESSTPERRMYTERLAMIAQWFRVDIRFLRELVDLDKLPPHWAKEPPPPLPAALHERRKILVAEIQRN